MLQSPLPQFDSGRRLYMFEQFLSTLSLEFHCLLADIHRVDTAYPYERIRTTLASDELFAAVMTVPR